MAKWKTPLPDQVTDEQGFSPLDDAFSRWCSGVEDTLRRLFVSDATIRRRVRDRLVIRQTIRSAEKPCYQDAVQAAVKAEASSAILADIDLVAINREVERQQNARKRASEALGRPELVAWGDFQPTTPGAGKRLETALAPTGVMSSGVATSLPPSDY